MAEDKRATIEAQWRQIDSLALLSEALNFDFGSMPMDQPFTDEQLDNVFQQIAFYDASKHGIKNRLIANLWLSTPCEDCVEVANSCPLGQLLSEPL